MPTKDVVNVASFQSLGQSVCSASTGLSRLQWPASSFEFNLDSFQRLDLGLPHSPHCHSQGLSVPLWWDQLAHSPEGKLWRSQA